VSRRQICKRAPKCYAISAELFRGLTATAVAFIAVFVTLTFPDVALLFALSAGNASNRIAVAGVVFVTRCIRMAGLALSPPQ
jgi:hypothetical protein